MGRIGDVAELVQPSTVLREDQQQGQQQAQAHAADCGDRVQRTVHSIYDRGHHTQVPVFPKRRVNEDLQMKTGRAQALPVKTATQTRAGTARVSSCGLGQTELVDALQGELGVVVCQGVRHFLVVAEGTCVRVTPN